MTTIPRKKIGIEVPTSALLVTARSNLEYLFLADMTPIGIAIKSENARPRSWSSSVAIARWPIKVDTGAPPPVVNAYPRFPVKSSLSQRKY